MHACLFHISFSPFLLSLCRNITKMFSEIIWDGVIWSKTKKCKVAPNICAACYCSIIECLMFQNLSSRHWILFSLVIMCILFFFVDSPRVLISQLKTQRSVEVGQEWKHFNYPEDASGSVLSYSYRVVCDPYYYGSQCSDMCKPRDDKFGHYTCRENGTKSCLDGWGGQFCDKGK